MQATPRAISEIVSTLLSATYQILGITDCACLAIPDHKIVAVRMYNHAEPNPPRYDYLEDIRSFGDQVLACCLLTLR